MKATKIFTYILPTENLKAADKKIGGCFLVICKSEIFLFITIFMHLPTQREIVEHFKRYFY